MELAKKHVDVGLYTNQTEGMLEYWRGEMRLPYEGLLKLGGGVQQHRFGLNGSVLKVNSVRDPLPSAKRSGYRELWIASTDVVEPLALRDADGNDLRLLPMGHSGVNGIALKLAVTDAARFRDFYGRVLRLPSAGTNTYRCGDSLLSFVHDPRAERDTPLQAKGFRYITVQVLDVDREHATALERGATEGLAPLSLGETTRISFLRDPDGNWIELSQRADLVALRAGT